MFPANKGIKTERIAVALMLFVLTGCGPSNLNECRSEAAKMPTERGVSFATNACYAKTSNALVGMVHGVTEKFR